MDTLPPPHLYSDPNERLLASAFPKPPPPLGVRTARAFARLSRREAHRIGAWLRSTSHSLPLLLACGGVGITIGACWGVASRAQPSATVATTVQAALHEAPAVNATQPPTPEARAELATIPCATGASTLAELEDVPVPSARSPRGAESAYEGATPSRSTTARRSASGKKWKKRGSSSGPPRARTRAVQARSAAKPASADRRPRPRRANAAGFRAVIASQ